MTAIASPISAAPRWAARWFTRAADHVIWFGLTWSLELYQQANKRLHRQGQRYPVIIHRLSVVDGMDEEVSRALEGKQDTQQGLLDALKARIGKVKRKD